MTRALLLTVWLAGCATAVKPAPATLLCPLQPIPYTKDDEVALKAEFDALADTSQLKRWIKDYIAERAALRACAAP